MVSWSYDIRKLSSAGLLRYHHGTKQKAKSEKITKKQKEEKIVIIVIIIT